MPEHSFSDHTLPRVPSQPTGLACEAAIYQRAHQDWLAIVAASPVLESQISDLDTMVCSADDITALVEQTSDVVVRQSLRMIAELREFTSTSGIPFQPSPTSQDTLELADAEWEQHLDQHPAYTKWLLQNSPVTCTRTVLLEAIERAPSDVTRHAMREVLIFREAFELAHGRVFR